MTKKDKDARASKVLKLGVVGAISSIPILYSLLAVGFCLSGDVNWFYSHFGYEIGYEFIVLSFIAFSLATLVLANYWLTGEEGRSEGERTIATICGLGLALFYGTVLLTMSAGVLVGGLAIERWAWVMFFGFSSGLSMSSIGAVLHFVFASDFGDLEST